MDITHPTPTYSPTIRSIPQSSITQYGPSDLTNPSPLSSPLLSLTPIASTPMPPVFLLNINNPPVLHILQQDTNNTQNINQNNVNNINNNNINNNNNNNNIQMNNNSVNNQGNLNNNNINNNNFNPFPVQNPQPHHPLINNNNNNNNNNPLSPNSLSVPSTPLVLSLNGQIAPGLNFNQNINNNIVNNNPVITPTTPNQTGILRRIAVTNNVQRSMTIEDEQVVPRGNSPIIASVKKKMKYG